MFKIFNLFKKYTNVSCFGKGPSINDGTRFWPILTPSLPLVIRRHKKSESPQIWRHKSLTPPPKKKTYLPPKSRIFFLKINIVSNRFFFFVIVVCILCGAALWCCRIKRIKKESLELWNWHQKTLENISRLAKTADVKNIVFKFSYNYQIK